MKGGLVSFYNARERLLLQAPESMIAMKYKDHFWQKPMLDIGCGGGRTSFYFHRWTQPYLGLDYSEAMIRQCKDSYSDVHFQQGDVRELTGIDDNRFDLVLFSFNGLDYISHEHRLKGLQEVSRVLKPGGLFVFSSHNRNYNEMLYPPRLEFSINPVKQLKKVAKYMVGTWNHLKNKSHQAVYDDYAIVNDMAHHYVLMTYYINRNYQARQLDQSGFDLLETYDLDGNVLDPADDDSNNVYLYYVAKKRVMH